jgi:hypothetical protein
MRSPNIGSYQATLKVGLSSEEPKSKTQSLTAIALSTRILKLLQK